MSGKGSKQRPTDKKKFDEGWDRIFKKTEQETDPVMDDYQQRMKEQFFEDASCTGGTLNK